jgi:hypothetical protein
MIIWPLLTFALVALTKYATSIRLRNLRDKIRRDRSEADHLRHLLFQSIESEEIIEKEKKDLIQKMSAFRGLIANLHSSLSAGEVKEKQSTAP